MALAGGDELRQVLDEQAAYYQALGGAIWKRAWGDIRVTAASGPFYWGAGGRDEPGGGR